MSSKKQADPAVRAPAGWRLRLVGTPTLSADGQAPVALLPTDALLLAWLAIEGPTTRSPLSGLLWPDENEPDLRNRLRQRLFTMKRRMGVDAVEGRETISLAATVHWDGWDSEAPEGELLGDTDPAGLPALAEWLSQRRLALRAFRRWHAAPAVGAA